jgi:hypothetical protein
MQRLELLVQARPEALVCAPQLHEDAKSERLKSRRLEERPQSTEHSGGTWTVARQ